MIDQQRPDIHDLFGEFGDSLPNNETVPDAGIPEPYRRLLVHPHHMTVTVEEYYGSPVRVQVLDRRRNGDLYARKILLVLESTGRIVQFGIVRIQLNFCSDVVQKAILSESAPLGRILIQNDVLRRIEPTGYVRLPGNAQLAALFGQRQVQDAWGRLAMIHCDGLPAIELLELLAPIT